jgi:hypothetical protein
MISGGFFDTLGVEVTLRRTITPSDGDLVRFCLGHANRSVTDRYSKLKEDVRFRKKVAEQVGNRL